jgi:leucine dehydrogenase
MFDAMGTWDGEEVVVRFDRTSGAWMLIGVHSTVLGPAMGGTRMKAYPSPEAALIDVCRLSQAMTMKQAAAGLPFGGGKAVIAVSGAVPAAGSIERRGLLERYARLIDALGGTYVTAADMNTGPADLDVIGETTAHVMGRSPERGGAGDSGPATAVGVFHAIRATCARVFGADDPAGRTVAIQGAGSVGSHLASLLAEAGASVAVADLDPDRAEGVASACGAAVVPVEDVLREPCDVLAPCATGGVLDERTIPLLRCRAVVGAANNQLATTADAGRLEARGILYAPDYVANAGGVIHLAGSETLGWDAETIDGRLAAIGDTLTEVFDRAEAEAITTAEAADRLAGSRIAAVSGGSQA